MRKSKKKAQPESDTTATTDAQHASGSDPHEASAPKTAKGQEATDVEGGEPDLEQQLSEMESKWLRARADLDNVRRRARLDVEEARAYSSTALLQSLLPVLDALQRALSASPTATGDEDDPILQGLRLTEQQFQGVLAAHGVTPVAADPGSPCDPTIHRVLIEQPSDEYEPGQIVSEITRGYKLHDRLLREAQVAVAAKAAAPGPTDGEQPDADL